MVNKVTKVDADDDSDDDAMMDNRAIGLRHAPGNCAITTIECV